MEKISDLEKRIEQSEDQQKKSTGGQTRMVKHYQLLPDGLNARDIRTGLIWRRAIEPGMFTYKQAVDHAARIAQQTGWPWRIPNKQELETLVEKTRMNPAIDTVVFPATPSTGFWSSSLHERDHNYAWEINFSVGYANCNICGTTLAVRLVR